MKKRHTWQLPLVINPPETICVQIQVPNDVNHIAAFWGALEALNKAWNWQYTTDHQGSQTARIWQDKIDTAAQNTRVGDNCMIDCDEVEACIIASPTIIAMQTNITNNTNNIANNLTLINQNITDITNLDNRVTTNEGTIAQHTIDIAQNEADILLQAVLINDNLLAIQSNDVELANHEIRITALEAGGGGGGSGQILEAKIEILVYDYTFVTEENSIGFAIDSQYTALRVEISVAGTGALPVVLMYVNNDLNNANYQWEDTNGVTVAEPRIGLGTGSGGLAIGSFAKIIVYMQNLDEPIVRTFQTLWGRRNTLTSAMAMNSFYMQWENDDTITNLNFDLHSGDWGIGSNIKIYGIKQQDILIPVEILNDPIVTFDPGGSPYTLPSGQVGIVSSGGNPNDCLFAQGLAAGEYLEVEVDLGEIKPIDSSFFDRYVEEGVNVSWEILVDDVMRLSFSGVYAVGSWGQVGGGMTSITGQVIRLRFVADVANMGLRIDNFKVFTS